MGKAIGRQQSTLNFQPEIIFQLDTLLDFKPVLNVAAKQVLGKVKSRDKDGVRQKCTEVKWTTGTERILCFDETTGSLLSVEYPRHMVRSTRSVKDAFPLKSEPSKTGPSLLQ